MNIGTTLTATLKGAKIKDVLWQRCASAPVGKNCAAPVTAGTGPTYVISNADANGYLRAVIAPRKSKRLPRPKRVMTRWFGPVPAPPAPAPTPAPTPAPPPYAGPGDARTNPLAYNQQHTLCKTNADCAVTETWSVRLSEYTPDANAIVAAVPYADAPDPGYRWMRFRVTLTNAGTAMQDGGAYEFTVFPSTTGVGVDDRYVTNDPGIERLPASTSVLPGGTITGYVYYQVPVGEPAGGVVVYANFSIYKDDGRFMALQ